MLRETIRVTASSEQLLFNTRIEKYKITKCLYIRKNDHHSRMPNTRGGRGVYQFLDFLNSPVHTNIIIIINIIKYLNNTIATRKNLYLWGLSNTSHCSFCLQTESLLHIVAGCKTYLNLKTIPLYVNLPGYLSPCIIMGDSLRPDMLLSTADKLHIIELTVGFETNLVRMLVAKNSNTIPS